MKYTVYLSEIPYEDIRFKTFVVKGILFEFARRIYQNNSRGYYYYSFDILKQNNFPVGTTLSHS